VKIIQTPGGLTKTVTVKVGHDTNGNASLDAGEVLVTFKTCVADMTAY